MPVLLALFWSLCIPEARATELPTELEAPYERAVIDFNHGKFESALSVLESKVLNAGPTVAPALELKALSLKALGRVAEALKTYAELVRVGPVSEKPKYYFEVGSLLHKQKRFAQARPYFNAALAGDFNVGACHYFLGLIDYEDRQYESAERHLVATVGSDANELKGLANFYLGVIYFRMNYPIGAIRGMRYARDAVEPWKSSPSAEQRKSAESIQDAARRVLKSLDVVRWFGNVAVLTQFDSNVSVLPDSVTSPDQTSGKRTVKQVFTGGGGLMTSPVRMFQAVATYRTYFNYNDNPDTKSFDFFSHIPALYLNYKPFLRLTPGIKIEGNYTFQNLGNRDTLIEFHPYSLTGELGPYARYEVNPHLITELDGFYRPKKYYQDPLTGEDRRTGDGYVFRASAEYTSPWKYLAPTGYLSYEYDNTTGKNWRYSAWGFGFSNITRFSPINTVTLGLDVSFPNYNDRLPQRNDTTLAARTAWIHALTRHFSLITDFSYQMTRSSLDSLFTYNRFFGDIGLSYTF